MEHEAGVGIVSHQGAGEPHGIVFFELGSFGLADNLDVHVRSGFGVELGIAGDKGDLKVHGVRARGDFDQLARHIRKLQATRSQPGDFGFVATSS